MKNADKYITFAKSLIGDSVNEYEATYISSIVRCFESYNSPLTQLAYFVKTVIANSTDKDVRQKVRDFLNGVLEDSRVADVVVDENIQKIFVENEITPVREITFHELVTLNRTLQINNMRFRCGRYGDFVEWCEFSDERDCQLGSFSFQTAEDCYDDNVVICVEKYKNIFLTEDSFVLTHYVTAPYEISWHDENTVVRVKAAGGYNGLVALYDYINLKNRSVEEQIQIIFEVADAFSNVSLADFAGDSPRSFKSLKDAAVKNLVVFAACLTCREVREWGRGRYDDASIYRVRDCIVEISEILSSAFGLDKYDISDRNTIKSVRK